MKKPVLVLLIALATLFSSSSFAEENRKWNTKQYFKTVTIWCEKVCNEDINAVNKIDNYLNDFQKKYEILNHSVEPLLVAPNYNHGGIWGYLITIRYTIY